MGVTFGIENYRLEYRAGRSTSRENSAVDKQSGVNILCLKP
jgi:hypothetical protein